jgi:arylformamidase
MAIKRKIFDISVPISTSLVVWPGHPPVGITHRSHLSKGDRSTVSNLSISAHTGTHVDAPAHFIPDGPLLDSLDLNLLIGDALVVDAGDEDKISKDFLEQLAIPLGTKRILFHTRNSERWNNNEREFTEKYVGITKNGAEWLVSRGVRLIGTDYLSVCTHAENVSAHQVLLSAGIILVEALNLYGIAPRMYHLICLPLKIADAEAAPARVVLVDQFD